MKPWILAGILMAGQATAACPPLSRDGLAQLLAKRPIRKLVFFASWCGECRSHIVAADPKTDVLIAAFDEQKAAERVLARLELNVTCFTDQGLTSAFGVRSVPYEILAPKI